MSDLEAAARRLDRIELIDVEETAALDTRIDRKYLVDSATAQRLVEAMSPRCQVLDIADQVVFDYRSEYFDTPTLDLYLDAARRRRRRYKVRTRLYAHMGTAYLEVKEKHLRGHTIKHRADHAVANLLTLDAGAKAFITSVLGDRAEIDTLVPTLTTTYERITLVDPGSATRFTIDRGVRADSQGGDHRALSGCIVETKSPLAPGPADRWLWQHRIRPERFSKYCTMLADMYPDLPRNKWHRTLQRAELVR